jgi:hypothetical protein
MKKIIAPFGLDWRRALELPLLRHELFYKFLLISPSYWIAHQIRKGKLKKSDIRNVPKDIDRVLEIYDLVGDIYVTTFDRWWSVCGRYIFDLHLKKESLSVLINLKSSDSEIITELQKLLKEIRSRKNSQNKINFVKTKMRDQMLQDRLQVVNIKAMHARFSVDEPKRDQNWKIYLWLRAYKDGNIERIFSGKGLNVNSKILAKNEQRRHYYGMAISRYLQESLNFAENAARGIFPSKSPVNQSKFDYQHVLKVTNNSHLTTIKQDNNYNANSGLLTRSQFNKTRKKLITKNKVTEKITIEAKKIIKNRLVRKNNVFF